jgi:hypothetical protein
MESKDLPNIDCSIVRALWQWLAEVQHFEGFNLSGLDQPRTFEQVNAHTQPLVLWDVFDQIFDLPNAPLFNAEWNWDYIFVWIEPRLVALTEHATLAFGMMRNRFENLAYMQTKDLVYRWLRSKHKQFKVENDDNDSIPSSADAEQQQQQRGFSGVGNGSMRVWTSAPRDRFRWRYRSIGEGRLRGIRWLCAEAHNPEFLHGLDVNAHQRTSKHRDGEGAYHWQVQKMAGAMTEFNTRHHCYPALRTETIARSLLEMLTTLVSVPTWENDQRHNYIYQAQQLSIVRDEADNTFSIYVPMSLHHDEVLGESRLITNTCLKDALRYVIQTEDCTAREILYGATHERIPEVWQTISLLSREQLGDMDIKPAHNVTVRDHDGRVLPEGHEIVGDLDQWFIDQFDIRHGFPELLRYLYPPRNPIDRMMELWFYTKMPYDRQRIPYPMHHEAYFPGALRAQKDITLSSNRYKRQRLLLEGPAEDRKEHKDRISALISERSGTQHTASSKGWQYPSVPGYDFPCKDLYTSLLLPWVKFMVCKRKDVQLLIEPWITGAMTVDWASKEWTYEGSKKSFPKHVVSPITRLSLRSSPQDKATYNHMRAAWTHGMLTQNACMEDAARRVFTIRGVDWRVHDAALVLAGYTSGLSIEEEVPDAALAALPEWTDTNDEAMQAGMALTT